ncbi:MAG: tetratricopeptide repeat protein [Hyphomicrobiaceae bacterium]
MFTRFRLTRFEAACARRFSGKAPAPAWDRLYCDLPFTLMEMAERNEPKAAYVLGDIFDQGMGGIKQDFEKALLYYRLAEKIEDPDALNNIGSMHYQGDALPLDREKARHYFERAVAGGCAAAMNNLGRMYLDGEGGAGVDIAKGLAILKRGAEAYDANAALKLKSIYYEGSYDQRKSQFKYVRWLWQAAFNGHAGSYAVIGDILAAGEIVKRQPMRVRPLYERALALSDGYGALCLGLDYCSGKCGEQDVERGLQYLRQAAAMGEEDAAEMANKIVQAMRTALE